MDTTTVKLQPAGSPKRRYLFINPNDVSVSLSHVRTAHLSLSLSLSLIANYSLLCEVKDTWIVTEVLVTPGVREVVSIIIIIIIIINHISRAK
jgi:hypothetical protein